ncbi:MAG: HD domain-containing phosphohydrolase [Coriobacteriia bacterium]|nr:HD domain-containing phosphohydrolase [Coriobacteriia bacterium]
MSDQMIDQPDSQNELSLLLEVGLQLAESLDLSTVLQTAVEGAVHILGQTSGSIYLLDGDSLLLGATVPPRPPGHAHLSTPLPRSGHPHVARAIDARQSLFVPDLGVEALTGDERASVEGRDVTSVLYVPIVASGRAEAVLILCSAVRHAGFGEQQLALCQMLSVEIGYAVANSRLYRAVESAARELSEAYDATLVGWSRALEMRDATTNDHTERTAALAVELAERLGIARESLDDIRRGALLHDIGKMAIPDSILRKPGPLDEAEWLVMRKHPEFAHELLGRIPFLSSALDIPYCHHEHWDGSGYPRGQQGEDIPLSARVFSVIDVYDALISDRPYRVAWTPEAAVGYIASEAGMQFDPEVTAAFVHHPGFSASEPA